ncbi:MAG: CDP-glycerol glycerophosphotransferase family protein [Enterobacterales bacterium endosymbiont of Blomia tropicalis]|uniref:CDP-glycerol glycerophosphotransferase family protein n=1 Tax=Mixta mediterraneensis TaxID=2758443 RepID=UPI0025A8E564|nr:CDP-glycerol glycerophosphotransferase family protein [Mixta mediterraneensis]MDL4912840.1 CDP-glycerol glycerophosphotransferase family protein [Mixta mediterraneensis]
MNSGLSRHENLFKINKEPNNLLFFFTWREEWIKSCDGNGFIRLVASLIENKKINKYASEENLNITFYLHEKVHYLKDELKAAYGDKINFVGQHDFSAVLSQTYLCITDYSSVAFEFNLIKTPVIFFQFDYDNYKSERGHYLSSPYEFKGIVVRTVFELEQLLEDSNLKITFKRLAKKNNALIRQDYINFGKTNNIIDNALSQKNKHIVYFCFNIYGVGGTVQTVINQANYLVVKGYQVSVISLRRTSVTPTLHLDPSVRIEYLNDVRNKGKYRNKLENILAQFPSKAFRKTEDLYSGLSLLIDIKLKRIIKSLKGAVLIGTFPGLCSNLIKYSSKTNKVIIQEH